MPPPAPVSVVIPARNAVRFLPQAIASVRVQDPPPAEILVVDDGSTDGTGDLSRALGARTLRRNDGHGAAAARNAGTAAAEQPWIAFLDADDRWRPEKLARQFAAVRAVPAAAIVATDYVAFAGDRVLVDRSSIRGCFGGDGLFAGPFAAPGIRVPDAAALRRALAYELPFAPSTLLVRRDVLLAEPFDAALPWSAELHAAEDYEWMLRVLRRAALALVDEPLMEYLLNPDGRSSQAALLLRGNFAIAGLVAATPARYLAGMDAEFAAAAGARVRTAVLRTLRRGDAAEAAALRRAYGAALAPPVAAGLAVLTGFASSGLGRIALTAARATWRARRGFARRLPS